MANFTRIRPPGFWVIGSVVDPQEFEDLDAIRTMLINAEGGSVHAPSSPIIIGGAGMQLTGPVQLSGAVTMPSGSLSQSAGAAWTLNHGISFASSAQVVLGSSTHTAWNGFATASIATDSEWTVYGGMTWQSGNWPRVTSRSVPRRGWRLGWTSYVGGTGTDPGTPRAWTKVSNIGGSGAAAIQTREETSLVGPTFVVELTDLPPGATLSSVTIKTKGTAGDEDVNLPTYQLVRWQGTGAPDLMSASTTDSHTGANWLTDVVDTVITCNANQVIDSSYRYGINVRAPYGTTAAAMQMYDFLAAHAATKIQL